MHDEKTVQKFIELRSQGATYKQLMTELNVSKPTLIAWSRKHQCQIQNLRAIEMEELADYVILDGPPMLAASDALTIAQQAGAVLLCSKLGEETGDDARQTRALLATTQATIFGIVVTGAKLQAKSYYSYERTPAPGGDAVVQAG